MKLIQCSKCNTYFREACINIEISVNLRLRDDGDWDFWDSDFSLCETKFSKDRISLNSARCPQCESVATLRIVEISECPHSWRKDWKPTRRKCRLCDKVERGQVVFGGHNERTTDHL